MARRRSSRASCPKSTSRSVRMTSSSSRSLPLGDSDDDPGRRLAEAKATHDIMSATVTNSRAIVLPRWRPQRHARFGRSTRSKLEIRRSFAWPKIGPRPRRAYTFRHEAGKSTTSSRAHPRASSGSHTCRRARRSLSSNNSRGLAGSDHAAICTRLSLCPDAESAPERA